MLDFAYTCRGCGHDFSLLVGDPRAELCPGCSGAVREDLTAEFAEGIIGEPGWENAEIPPRDSSEELYDELVGALLDVQDLISARAPAGAHRRSEDGPLYRRIFDALQKAAA